MAVSKGAYTPARSPRFKASTRLPKTWMAHIATFRVDMGTSARSWVMWAKNRLSAAAAIAVQINPSTRVGLAVSKACKLAYDFHSLNSNSTCHLHLYARQISSKGYRWDGKFVRKEQKLLVRRFQLKMRRRHRGPPSTCHCTRSSTRWRLGSLAWMGCTR